MSSEDIKNVFPIWLISAITAFFLVEYFTDVPALTSIKSEFTTWGTVVSGFMLIFGIVILFRYHFLQITVRKLSTGDKMLSVLFFIAFFAFAIVGFSSSARTSGELYQWMYQNMYRPAGTSITAMCLWWCIYGGYKMFSIRSWESAAIGFGSVLYMLWLLPVGTYLVPPLGPFADWILSTINMGATRGAMFALGTGALALGFRTLIGKEKGVTEVSGEG